MTIEQFQIQLQSFRLNSFFPSILPIGCIHNHIVFSEVEKYTGLCFDGFGQSKDIFQQIESILLTLLSTTSKNIVEITIYDAQFEPLFPNIKKIDYETNTIRWKTFNNLSEDLNTLIERNKRIFSNYLDENYTSINDYNKAFPEDSITYEFIILPFVEQIQDLKLLQTLFQLSRYAIKTGLYIICTRNLNLVTPINEYDNTIWERKQLLVNLTDNMSTIINSSVHPTFKNISEDQVQYINNFGFNFFKFDYKYIAPSIIDKHQMSDEDDEQDFISIPIGKQGKKNIYLKFGDKSNRGGFIGGKQGSGKSTLLRHIINGIVNQYSPNEVKLYLFDLKEGSPTFGNLANLKHVELLVKGEKSAYRGIKRLEEIISSKVEERVKLYNIQSNKDKLNAVDNLSHYVKRSKNKPPVYLIIYEEGEPLLKEAQKVFYELQGRIASKFRSYGIYHLFATQILDIFATMVTENSEQYTGNCDISICGEVNYSHHRPIGFEKDPTKLGLKKGTMAIKDVNYTATEVFSFPVLRDDDIISKAKELGYWSNMPNAEIIEGNDTNNNDFPSNYTNQLIM